MAVAARVPVSARRTLADSRRAPCTRWVQSRSAAAPGAGCPARAPPTPGPPRSGATPPGGPPGIGKLLIYKRATGVQHGLFFSKTMLSLYQIEIKIKIFVPVDRMNRRDMKVCKYGLINEAFSQENGWT